jgi:hypothetical protein
LSNALRNTRWLHDCQCWNARLRDLGEVDKGMLGNGMGKDARCSILPCDHIDLSVSLRFDVGERVGWLHQKLKNQWPAYPHLDCHKLCIWQRVKRALMKVTLTNRAF